MEDIMLSERRSQGQKDKHTMNLFVGRNTLKSLLYSNGDLLNEDILCY